MYTIRDEIELETRHYADVDWVLRFPRVAAFDKDRLIKFSAVLNRSYASAFALGPPPAGEACPAFDFALCEFRALYAAGAISRSDFEWYQRKVHHTEADYVLERAAVAKTGSTSPVRGCPARPSEASCYYPVGANKEGVRVELVVDGVTVGASTRAPGVE